MRLIEKVWFKQHKAKYVLVPLLLPLTLLFYLITTVRRLFFRLGFIKSVQLSKPVIVVGNIGIGGNGKTPMVLSLVKMLKALGFNPGVISRGYGGQAPYYPFLLDEHSTAEQAGDEPILIYQRCQVPLAVGSDRIASAQALIDKGCDVIISDDGLQHYRLQRDIELIIVDGNRLFGNDLLLPAGPLREGVSRLSEVDLVVVNGGQALAHSLNSALASCQEKTIAMSLLATDVVQLKTGKVLSVKALRDKSVNVNAAAGIGDPQRFFNTLSELGFELDIQQGFVDHHSFCLDDFIHYDDNTPLLMTEKDAVKCRHFAQDNWWYLPVEASYSEEQQAQLLQLLTTKLKRD